MPAVPFFATGTPPGQMTTIATSEKLSVTNVTGDVLTIVRAQGSTTAKSIAAGWIISNGVYSNDVDSKADTASPTLTGTPAAPTATAGDSTTQLATTAFVQMAVRSVPSKEASKYATTAALATVTYNNGTSGTGATLTGVAMGAIGIDSQSPIVGDRILVKNQVSTFQNGIYDVTATGSGVAVFVLTRSLDFNQTGDIKTGATTYVVSGTTLAATTWDVSSADSPVMGTDAITFIQSAGPGSLIAGTGIGISGVTVAIDTSITVDKTTVQTLTNKTVDGVTPTIMGYLDATSSVQTQLNSKQATLSLTTTGASGAATLTGATLNIPQYSGGGGGITFSAITTSQTAAINTGYLTNAATLITLTLPATAAVGSVIEVAGMGTGLWKVAQNASGVIHFGNKNTTTGTGGSLASSLQFDTLRLVCSVANNEWVVLGAVGNLVII